MRTVTHMPRKTSHGFHLIMTILTAGLWLPIWMLAAANATRSRKVVTHTKPAPAPQQLPQHARVYYAPNGRPYRILPNGQSVWV